MDTIVGLNVGGRIFQTLKSTIENVPDSMLCKMLQVQGMNPGIRDKDGNYFFDRDGDLFPNILEIFRSGKYPSHVEGKLKKEIEYWFPSYHSKSLEEIYISSVARGLHDEFLLDFFNTQTWVFPKLRMKSWMDTESFNEAYNASISMHDGLERAIARSIIANKSLNSSEKTRLESELFEQIENNDFMKEFKALLSEFEDVIQMAKRCAPFIVSKLQKLIGPKYKVSLVVWHHKCTRSLMTSWCKNLDDYRLDYSKMWNTSLKFFPDYKWSSEMLESKTMTSVDPLCYCRLEPEDENLSKIDVQLIVVTSVVNYENVVMKKEKRKNVALINKIEEYQSSMTTRLDNIIQILKHLCIKTSPYENISV